MSDSISSRIDDRRRALAGLIRKRDDLTRQIQTTEIELRAYEDALVLMTANNNVNKDHSRTATPERAPPPPKFTPKGIGYAASRMSDQWRLIFTEMKKRNPAPMAIQEMKGLAAQNNIVVNDQSVRTSLHKFSARGWINRVGMGEYTITNLGIEALDMRASAEEALEFVLSVGESE
jgi:hypothetical protein